MVGVKRRMPACEVGCVVARVASEDAELVSGVILQHRARILVLCVTDVVPASDSLSFPSQSWEPRDFQRG